MKSEIKDGLFTSTQASELLAMNVQTLREWQRKKYISLPDTGGWQRYRLQDVFAIFTMDRVLQSGVKHELAASIAEYAYPMYVRIMKDIENRVPADQQTFRLLVLAAPNQDTSFQLISGPEELHRKLDYRADRSTLSLLVDFRDIFEDMNFALEYHTYSEGERMYWKSEAGIRP